MPGGFKFCGFRGLVSRVYGGGRGVKVYVFRVERLFGVWEITCLASPVRVQRTQ